MIDSLNATLTDDKLELLMEELEDREEMICFLNACSGNAEFWILQACAVACFGISACAVGAHSW